jgi:integrating conjugative element protein (TIGR03759 family)
MSKKSLILSLLALSASASAELTIPGIAMHHTNASALAATDKTLAKTGLSVNEDDITSDQDINALKLTALQLHDARVWGLTEEEEKRYVFLMQNRSAIYYKGLRQTPIDVLGINARNEAERSHFAKLSAQMEAQKVSKNIAWNNAFYKAYNQLFANVPVVGEFDASVFSPTAYKPIILNEGDTLFLFIKTDDAIKTVLLALIDAINTSPNTRLHLMILGADDLAIQQWANQNQIPHELVTTGAISLNHGDLNFEALTVTKKVTPLLLLARHGASSLVDLGAF